MVPDLTSNVHKNGTTEMVILVDPQDHILGYEEKLKAHQLGLLHRAFSIFVFRKTENTIEFLLQQRSMQKYHSAGLWSNTCCSHPRINETPVIAGERRLIEELGCTLKLQSVGHFQYHAHFDNGLIEHELDHVLIGEYLGEALQPEKSEVQDLAWINISTLRCELENQPHKYTAWFKPALHLVEDYLCIRS